MSEQNVVQYDIPNEPEHKRRKVGWLPGWVDWGLRFYVMLMVPFLLAVGSSRLVMTPAFLTFEYQQEGFPVDRYGMTTETRLEYGPYGVLYIINNEPLSYLGDLELPGNQCVPQQDEPCVAFREDELVHMEDVQIVAQGLFTAGFWNVLLVAGAITLLWRGTGLHAVRLALMQGGMLTIGLIVATVLLAITAWDVFFTQFHNLFFEEGTWRFFFSDTLIRLYPEPFWFRASIVVGVLTILGAIIILAVAWRLPVNRGHVA